MTSQDENDSRNEAKIGMAVNTATKRTASPIIRKPKRAFPLLSGMATPPWGGRCRRGGDGGGAGEGRHQLAAFSRSLCSPSRAALASPEDIAWVVR